MKRIGLLILTCLALCSISLSQTQEERLSLRLIAVRSDAESARLRSQIQTGVPFETLAREHSIDPSASAGGYIGLFRPADLAPELQQAVRNLEPGQVSAVTPLGDQFLLIQRLSLDETNWIASNDSGIQAFRQGRYEEAARNFLQATQYAEKLTPGDYRLEDSLHGLAESYRLQKKYSEAEPFYLRYLTIHWSGPNVPEVLDGFCTLLTLAYFRDSQFDEALRKFQEAVQRGPISEDLYQAMGAILFKAELIPEAEALMTQAARQFPGSRDVHFHLAKLYRSSMNPRKALDAFEQLTRMKAPSGIDPSLDGLQQSIIYQNIGSIRAELVEFDEAASAYRKALELTPDSVESRLGIGDLYLQQGNPEDALAEYVRIAAADPQNVTAHVRIADANLQLGRFQEAASEAATALRLNPKHAKAHFVQATALLRMDRKEEAATELELSRKLEAEERADRDRRREITVLNRGAAAKLLEGHPEEAIQMFLKIIQTYPDEPSQYLNLGAAQSKIGQHQAAIDTFKKMINLGMDSFLVYRNLAQEYQALGDAEASLPPEVVYLQNVDLALREGLDWNLE